MELLIHPFLCSSNIAWHLPPAVTLTGVSEPIQRTEMLRSGMVQASGQIQVELFY